MHLRNYSDRWRLLTADLSGLSSRILDDAALLQGILIRSLRALELEVGHCFRHEFVPQGVSLLGHGPRVRFALHTWPERGSITLDVWTDAEAGHIAVERFGAALQGTQRSRPAPARVAVSPGD